MYRLYFTVVFLLGIFSPSLCQRTPTISKITQEQIKDIGDTVELECSVQYAQSYPVLWVKVYHNIQTEPVPISSGSGLLIHEGRFSLRYDPASSTYTLQIKDIQETDSGYYQCQVYIGLGNKISAEVELQVRRPPITSDNSTRSVTSSNSSPYSCLFFSTFFYIGYCWCLFNYSF